MDAYTQQQEVERLKNWWKEYGNALIAGVVIGVAILFGTKYWKQYQEGRRVEASVLYEQMLTSARGTQKEAARTSGERLIKDFDNTPYAAIAALMLARQAQESGDAAGARRHLEWVVANARQDAVQHAARLRLARLLGSGGEHAAALAVTEIKDRGGFEADYLELRGDLLAALGRVGEARTAYRDALTKMREPSPYQSVVRMKLDALGPEKGS